MSIPWPERQLRIAEIKRRQLEPPEKPRFALRLARFFIGEDYYEECLPAWFVNLFGFAAVVIYLAGACITVMVAYLAWRYLTPTTLVLVLAAAIWPVVRLSFLNQNDVILRDHEGITNPPAQRVFSRVALVCLAATVLTLWLGHHDPRWYAGSLLLLGLYGWITTVVFERSIHLGFDWLSARLTSPDLGENDDDTSTPHPTRDDGKQKAFVIVSVTLFGTTALIVIYLAVEKIWCSLFACH